MSSAREPWMVWGGLSLGVHLVAVSALALAPTQRAPVAQPIAVPITIEISEPPPAPSPVPSRPEPQPVPSPSRPSRPAPTSEPFSPTAPSPVIAPAPIEVTPNLEPSEPVDRTTIDRPSVSLAPARVAASMAFEGGGPSVRGAPATLDDPGRLRPTPIGEAMATIQGSLAAAASDRGAFSERPYRVVQRPDGAYHYEGQGFEGIIEPDGSVRFSDRPGITFDPATGGGSFDLTDAVMRALGQDPYNSERLGFMEATGELRERLEDAARVRWAASSMRRLRGRLARLWQDETRAPEHRRRAIFEMWDELAETADGAEAREVVMAFVREERAIGGDMVFDAAELERLNRSRQSLERFAP